jgi:hypothetical protein
MLTAPKDVMIQTNAAGLNGLHTLRTSNSIQYGFSGRDTVHSGSYLHFGGTRCLYLQGIISTATMVVPLCSSETLNYLPDYTASHQQMTAVCTAVLTSSIMYFFILVYEIANGDSYWPLNQLLTTARLAHCACLSLPS